MNKFSFIKELLENNKFNSNQMGRFLKLVTKELEGTNDREMELINDVAVIKEKLGLNKSNQNVSIESAETAGDWIITDYEPSINNEEIQNENYIKEKLGIFNLEYLEPHNKNTDPRNTSLNERIDVLSKVTDKSYKDRKPLLEGTKEKYEDLGSKKAVEAINRVYFMVKQIEVLNGVYEDIGISKDTFIIPSDITEQLIERFKKSSNYKEKDKDKNKDIKQDDNINNLPTYFYPSSTYKFLFNYNQNRILKSTCHDIGSQELLVINDYCKTEEYDFNTHLEKVKEVYESHEKKHFAPSFLKTRFRVYLTGKNYYGKPLKGWSEDSIKVNWSLSDLRIWSEENPGIPPNLNEALIEILENTGFENFESFTSNTSGTPIQSFTELVYHFKNSFHLRGDNPLRGIIERTNNLNNWNEHIDFIIENDTFPANIEHFTDVDKLIQAYKIIIELIIEVTDKYNLEMPKVKIAAKVNLEEFQLSIHHVNSIYKKTISNTLERIGQNYRNLIENQINGLCNLILKAEFESDPKSQINIWNGKDRKAEVIEDNSFKGVEHIFQFPKK